MKWPFRIHKVIKIPGKTFDDLSWQEVALMIEADSSISPEGNEYFSSEALDEFLHNARLERHDLQELRDEILRHIYIDVEGTRRKAINVDYLKSLASSLRAKSQQ